MSEIEKIANSFLNKVPSREKLEGLFSFVDDETVRTNIIIALRYIIFQVVIKEKLKLTGTLSYSHNKSIILYTASIVECLLHYFIKKFVDVNKLDIKTIMPSDWVYKNIYTNYEIPNSDKKEQVISSIRHKKYEKFTDGVQFKTLNKVAKNLGILNEKLFKQSDKLREDRNKIHLTGLNEGDDYFDRKDIDRSLDTLFDISKRIVSIEEKDGDLYR